MSSTPASAAPSPKLRARDSIVPDPLAGSAPRFSLETLKRDAPAGVITGLMAIPLTVGICLMSDFPVQSGLATVVVACVISFVIYLFRPGNHIGVPGVAAGLAPVMALGVHHFGVDNMPWLIFLTATFQAVVWRYRLEVYILKAVPHFLIEGLLAGVGLKIAMTFFPFTYETIGRSEAFWTSERMAVVASSAAALFAFVYLYRRFKETSPGAPYIVVVAASILLGLRVQLPMLEVEPVSFRLALPLPDFGSLAPLTLVEMVVYALMLGTIDVIEQVMSNAAIEKIDPLGRKADSNNSLLVMWLGNAVSSLFGGMTNLDGLAKSSTNRMAGAVTKMSALFVAAVLGLVLLFQGRGSTSVASTSTARRPSRSQRRSRATSRRPDGGRCSRTRMLPIRKSAPRSSHRCARRSARARGFACCFIRSPSGRCCLSSREAAARSVPRRCR